MSHVVQIQTQVRDAVAVRAGCKRLGLGEFLQAYAVERTKVEARRKGYSVIEQPLADGSIKLTLSTGAEA